MEQATLIDWEKEVVDAQEMEKSFAKEYEYNIKNIHREYSGFDIEKGLPSTSIELGTEVVLPIKAFMAWRALVCGYYCTAITTDPNAFSYIISYYDKYEIPTCYRTIKINYGDVTTISTVGRMRGRTFESASVFFKKALEQYLINIGFMRAVEPKSFWAQVKKWFTSRR